MAASKRVSRRSSGCDLARVDAHVIQPNEYEELSELTDDMLARGKVNKGGRASGGQPSQAHVDSPARRCHSTLARHRAGLANAHGRPLGKGPTEVKPNQLLKRTVTRRLRRLAPAA